jgi:hypothetical protein
MVWNICFWLPCWQQTKRVCTLVYNMYLLFVYYMCPMFLCLEHTSQPMVTTLGFGAHWNSLGVRQGPSTTFHYNTMLFNFYNFWCSQHLRIIHAHLQALTCSQHLHWIHLHLQVLEFITSPQSLHAFVTFSVDHIVIKILQASRLTTSPHMVFQCVDNNIIDIDNVANNKNKVSYMDFQNSNHGFLFRNKNEF